MVMFFLEEILYFFATTLTVLLTQRIDPSLHNRVCLGVSVTFFGDAILTDEFIDAI